MKRTRLISIFFALLIALQACSPSTASTLSVSDITGREVTVKQPVERVVLTFNFEEYIAATGEEGISKIAGWSTQYWKGRRQSTWDAFSKRFPIGDIPDVGYVQKNSFNVEAVMALRPDVVFMPQNDLKLVQDELKRLEGAGIPVVFVDYHAQTLENHVKSTLLFGKIMGAEGRAQELVEYYTRNFKAVQDRVADISGPRPRVYMEFSGNQAGPEVYGPTWGKKMWGGIIENCRGDNIARDLVPGANGDIQPEQILAANPDVIIFAGNYVGDSAKNVGLGYEAKKELVLANLEGYKGRPGWEGLNAVRENRMGALYHDLSRHIFDVAGMQFIAKMLYPDTFSDLDPQATLQEFYDRFFPIDMTGTFMVELNR